MTQEFLDSIENISKELDGLKKRLQRMEEKENTIITVSVQGSSRNFPYTQHNYTIVEIPQNRNLRKKYKKLIKNKKFKLEKLKLQLEYELNYVKDADIREIIRLRYNDNKTWLQIMFEMNYNSESTAKLKLKRFLEKNKKM